MKSTLLPDHMPVNNFELIVLGAPRLHFITLDGIEEELNTIDLPDRTKASGGATMPIEFTGTHPRHHFVENTFLEAWFLEAKLAVPTYKKAGTLLLKSISNLQIAQYSLVNLFLSKRKTPDLDIENEGELATIEWTFMGDLVIPT